MEVKLRSANVYVGGRCFTGVMFEDGSYGISIPQIAQFFRADKEAVDCALSDVEKYNGEPINIKTLVHELEPDSEAVDYISLDDFSDVILQLMAAGNKLAKQFVFELFDLSLQRLYGDYVKWTKSSTWHRELNLKSYHPDLTKWFTADGCDDAGFSERLARFKAILELPLVSVRKYTKKQLDRLRLGEKEYNAYRAGGLSHSGAIRVLFYWTMEN